MQLMARYATPLLAAIIGTMGLAHAQTIKVDKNNRTIAVTASDKALTDADLAVVHIGFQVFGADEQSTYASGSTTSNAIIDALKKAGVPEKSIESENQSLQPNNYHDPKESEMDRAKKQFVLNQSWTVKTKPPDRLAISGYECSASQSRGQRSGQGAGHRATDGAGAQRKAGWIDLCQQSGS